MNKLESIFPYDKQIRKSYKWNNFSNVQKMQIHVMQFWITYIYISMLYFIIKSYIYVCIYIIYFSLS